MLQKQNLRVGKGRQIQPDSYVGFLTASLVSPDGLSNLRSAPQLQGGDLTPVLGIDKKRGFIHSLTHRLQCAHNLFVSLCSALHLQPVLLQNAGRGVQKAVSQKNSGGRQLEL